MGALANRHINAHEVFLELNTYGEKQWHQRYNFLKISLLSKYFMLNNQEVLGNAFVLAPYFKFNVLNKDVFQLRFRTSIGPGYMERRFDADENYKNIAIGSHLNMYLSLNLESSLKLTKTLFWDLAIGFDHLSNTGFKTPNLGINMPMVSSGLHLDFGAKKAYRRTHEPDFERGKAYWQLTGGVGLNENYPANGETFLASALSISREKRMNYKSSLGFGLDFFNNPANKAYLEKNGEKIEGFDQVQVGASVIHLLHFGKLIFTSQLSVYLKNENKDLGAVYHIFGGRMPINERVNAFFYGKTHIDKAEYLIFGLGYRFRNE